MLLPRITGKGKFDGVKFNCKPIIVRLAEKEIQFDETNETMTVHIDDTTIHKYNEFETITKKYAETNNLQFKSSLISNNCINFSPLTQQSPLDDTKKALIFRKTLKDNNETLNIKKNYDLVMLTIESFDKFANLPYWGDFEIRPFRKWIIEIAFTPRIIINKETNVAELKVTYAQMQVTHKSLIAHNEKKEFGNLKDAIAKYSFIDTE